MKSLFLYCCTDDDLNYLPNDLEYLFINTLILNSKDDFIKPNISLMLKLMYVHRIRIKSHYYLADINISLPFNSKYIFNNRTFLCYNFEININTIMKYINLFNDNIEDVFNNCSYWFNIHEKDQNFKYTYQNFNNSIVIYKNSMENELDDNLKKWVIVSEYDNNGVWIMKGDTLLLRK